MHLFSFTPPRKGHFSVVGTLFCCLPCLSLLPIFHPPVWIVLHLWQPLLSEQFLKAGGPWARPRPSSLSYLPRSIFLSDLLKAHGFEFHFHADIPKLMPPAQTSPLRSSFPLLSPLSTCVLDNTPKPAPLTGPHLRTWHHHSWGYSSLKPKLSSLALSRHMHVPASPTGSVFNTPPPSHFIPMTPQ